MFEKLFDIEISVPTRFLLEVVLRRETERKCYKWEKNVVVIDTKKKKLKIEEDNFMMTNLILCLIRWIFIQNSLVSFLSIIPL